MEKLKWVYEQRLKDSWNGTNLSFEKDRAYGFSWPQRNYECSFCKKEFKSAQALGGHMNVHRRDRARMRLSPSWDHHHHHRHSANPNPNPKTNPSFSSSSTANKFLPYNKASLEEQKVEDRDMTSLLRGPDMGKKKKAGPDAMIEFSSSFAARKDSRVWKGNEFVRLDLNLGLVHDPKEDLDLELRLGYSN